MKHRLYLVLSWIWLGALAGSASAQITAVADSTVSAALNWQAVRGLPISTTSNSPAGSDGTMPTTVQVYGGVNPGVPTTNQFASVAATSGGIYQTGARAYTLTNNPLLNGSNAFGYAVALAMACPTGSNGTVVIERSARIGLPYFIQNTAYYFGSVISQPIVDYTGQNRVGNGYWQPAPWSGNSNNSSYYYSPNANAVFATQPGQIAITWITSQRFPQGSQPAYVNNLGNSLGAGAANYITNQDQTVSLLYTVDYLVSPSAAQKPQQMFWTEGSFRKVGHPVTVSAARISGINVIYNTQFPKNVTTPYFDSSSYLTNETRTLWYDSDLGVIHAYNAVGQVFVEILGQKFPNGTSQFLGYEIVNVVQSAPVNYLTNNLGDLLYPLATGDGGLGLAPSPLLGISSIFYYLNGSDYYGDHLTAQPTDLLLYWLNTGVAGLQWPALLDSYTLVWPKDPSLYSYYLRPNVNSAAAAAQTAVAFDATENVSLDYQDPLDGIHGGFKNPSPASYYSWLSPQYPAHRALLRFNANGNVRFERVFSILDTAMLNTPALSTSVATNLTAWNSSNYTLTNWPANFNPPYVVTANVNVGDRINPPTTPDQINGGLISYPLAGYINTNQSASLAGSLSTNLGSSYDPLAYLDPFTNGLATAAAMSSIIPVNAIPGHNGLEVWWFSPNDVDPSLGFHTLYWPSVVGYYNVQWPAQAPAIVLANNAGSGPLDSLHAGGNLYYQNDPTQPGYNPNEEHAVMLGGQVYALRDDLNLTNSGNQSIVLGANYSSAPFVLLGFTDSDGRPSMNVYRVMRENPAAGQYFDYPIAAGTELQAPMPLPLLAPPVAFGTNFSGGFTNYNSEIKTNSGDLPNGWAANDATNFYGAYQGFAFQDRNHAFWVYRGLGAGLPPLQAGTYNVSNNTFGSPAAATAVLNQPFKYCLHVSRLPDSLTYAGNNLPPGLSLQQDTTNGLQLTGVPTVANVFNVTITINDTADQTSVSLPLTVSVVPSGNVVTQGPLVIASTNTFNGQVDAFTNRPPCLAQSAAPSNSFAMNFYYKTQPGFAWPGTATPPPVGSIVPYLRSLKNGSFQGDPTSSNTPSLKIVYRPIWPEIVNGQPVPTLQMGQTLTTAINGLPAVRGQDSVQILFQQSLFTNTSFHAISQGTNPASPAESVVLFDPTVQKTSPLASGIPGSVISSSYQGLYYFPNLPPNLVSRVWYDPNSQNLVLSGQFVNDPVKGNYVMLNVLSPDDLAAVKSLCPVTDIQNYPYWTNAVAGLTVSAYTFGKDIYGNYVVNPAATVTRGVNQLVQITNSDTAVDSYAMSAVGPGSGYVSFVVANGNNPKYAGDPVTVYVVRVGQPLFTGGLVVANAANASPFSQLITFEHTADLAGRTGNYTYDWRIIPPVSNGQAPSPATIPSWTVLTQTNPGPVLTLGAQGIQGISDNYVTMRYGQRLTNAFTQVVTTNWSSYATPILAQGWITRVTQAMDPIAGTTVNLYQNPASTTASIIQLAGTRYNGNVPLNQASLTNSGLISLYETVLNIGKNLSINSGINYGPANNSLLTAAGYLNDLYMTLGNAAWADSLNPTIGFGTDNSTYGSVATASFSFEGEEPTLLEQNLALLRGRDDSVSPGVYLPPVYNRLFWNYTYGLSAGQTIYALNYNIQDQNSDGVVNAADAATMFPQGHGDAYGHYLTSLTDYYQLLMNPNFTWLPQAQTVQVLGAAVTVNYENETKFAASAAAVARTGRQIFDLTWREDYQPGTAGGWGYFDTNFVGQDTYVDNNNNARSVTRYWGMDHWAARVGQGAYLNWAVANALLPYQDPNPNDQGVEIVDRQTVQDIPELTSTLTALQSDIDNANAGFTPLNLSQNAIPFDINPKLVTGANPQTHFEQIYNRAVQALNNAVVAFNDAQNVTQQLRQQQNSLTDLKAAAQAQENAYNDQLIDLYGTPYPDDVGPAGSYPQGYSGPDLIHYMYVDNADTNTFGGILPDPTSAQTFQLDIQNFPANWNSTVFTSFNFVSGDSSQYTASGKAPDYINFNVDANGFLSKPASWSSVRGSVGKIQNAATAVNTAQDQLRTACFVAQRGKQALDQAVALFDVQDGISTSMLAQQEYSHAVELLLKYDDMQKEELNLGIQQAQNAGLEELQVTLAATPSIILAGLADGGDQSAPLKAVTSAPVEAATEATVAGGLLTEETLGNIMDAADFSLNAVDITMDGEQYALDKQNAVQALVQQELSLQNDLAPISQALSAVSAAQANYRSLVAEGNRLQQERLTFRQHEAVSIQGFTVNNAASLIFQNEDLQRYTTLFNLAAQYCFMTAQAYDYETGLLGTPAGGSFINQIIGSSALGVIRNGQPQISGTSTGDPGLANALAEMYADWSVLKGRLGFNNPDGYGTIASLRSENFRILPGAAGDNQWKQLLQQSLVPNLLADPDVKNNCLQVDDGSGQAQPGIVLTFGTTITDGKNLFGQPLGPGDHAYSSSSFATKIFSAGICFDGYVGMDNPVSNSGAGGTSPADPTLDPNGLAATPYVYLIPCGQDTMRSPPLGDTSSIRTWSVDDVAIPLPFNIGQSGFSSAPFYTAADSLSEPFFAVRKQQAFRPVSTTAAFSTSIYGATGALQPSQYSNSRLIGRSIWNTKWKLIIPGKSLLADPNAGLQRFINSVKDAHLYFITYSYSGN